MTALKISERNSGGTTILDLEGKVVLGDESTALREAIRRLLDAGKKSILLNLSGVADEHRAAFVEGREPSFAEGKASPPSAPPTPRAPRRDP